MPGPCNNRRKKKQHKKPSYVPLHTPTLLEPQTHDLDDSVDDPHGPPYDTHHPCDDGVFIAAPNIYDPGNGPRVRDTRAFLSSFFAQPPALDDELCAEFAQEEILQMLCTVLPEETAIVRLSACETHAYRSPPRSSGTTRVVPQVVSALRVDACTVWATSFQTLSRTLPNCSLSLDHHILLVNRIYLAYVGDLQPLGNVLMIQLHRFTALLHYGIFQSPWRYQDHLGPFSRRNRRLHLGTPS